MRVVEPWAEASLSTIAPPLVGKRDEWIEKKVGWLDEKPAHSTRLPHPRHCWCFTRLYYQRMDFVSSISFTILHILCWEHFIFLRQIALSFSSAFCCCFQFARYRWKPTRVALEKATRQTRTRWDSLYLSSCMKIICEGVHVFRVGTNINVVVVGSTWGEMWNMHSSKFKLFVCWEFKAFASALCRVLEGDIKEFVRTLSWRLRTIVAQKLINANISRRWENVLRAEYSSELSKRRVLSWFIQ